MKMNEWLQLLFTRKAIRAIDRQFAQFIAQQIGDANAPIVGWAALVSFELGKGNVCVDLARIDASRLFDLMPAEASQLAIVMQPEHAEGLLAASAVVGDGSTATPLVLDGSRLYLHRYWQAEQQVAEKILQRTEPVVLKDDASALLDGLFTPDFAWLRQQFAHWETEDKAQKLMDALDIVAPEKMEVTVFGRRVGTRCR